MPKLIVTLEVETERDIPDLGSYACCALVMHSHIIDANVVCIGESLTHTHAPKPGVRPE